MTADEKENGIKVTDRRMFTADGELRGSEAAESLAEPAEPGSPAVAPNEPAQQEQSQPPPSERIAEARKPEFTDLVSVLAEPIALFLGDVALPDGGSAENLDLARFHIDLLEVLKMRTDASLSQDERALLDGLLYTLRMRYVQKTR